APTEALLLSTCNRVELYLATADVARTRQRVREELARLGRGNVLPHLRERHGEDALLHLFRVASSLDSMVLGEAQVLGQVKRAFQRAQAAGTARKELSRAFTAAFRCAKRVRTETTLGGPAASMASAAVALASELSGGLSGKTVLLVGAGEMARTVARHARRMMPGRLLVTNRTLSRAEALAAEAGGTALPFGSLPQAVASADVVLCGTASPEPLFGRDNVAAALLGRGSRPLVMVDLAVPRDIAPEVRGLEGVRVADVDDVQRYVADHTANRALEVERAEAVLAEESARFARDKALREGVPVLATLRQRADTIASAEAERTLSLLGEGLTGAQRKSVKAMATAIVNKLLHEPTVRLRATAGEHGGLALVEATAELFGLTAQTDAGG
ncbi:MAG TPA: glutamyl-tRNA reductase, partial [Longimicrobium sp.]|nr:glutamyl-tRNA reductase [Longimicrobium sp.]